MEQLRQNRRRRGIRLFDHPLLDWGSRVHPVLPGVFWGPILIVATYWGVRSGVTGTTCVFVFVLGYVSWLFTEYAIHRWLFHFRPRQLWLRRLMYYIHEHHHRYQEWDRLLAPPLLSVSLGVILIGVLYLLIGRTFGPGVMCVFLGGYTLAYLVYDYTHFWIHFSRPRSRWGRFLRRCHLEHHFTQPDRWYCISFPLIDYVFRTNGRRYTGDHSSLSLQFPAEVDDPAIPLKVRQYEAGRDRKR